MIIYGKNSVTEIIKNKPFLIKKLFIRAEQKNEYISLVSGQKPEYLVKDRFDALIKDKRNQGIAADIHDVPLLPLNHLYEKRSDSAVWILLDEIQDPHNLGSVIRTAYGLGVQGIILAQDRTCGITPAVFTASAGYAAVLPIIALKNPANSIKEMKKAGYWIGTVDMNGEIILGQKKDVIPRPIILVIGNEGEGVRETYKKNADLSISIPQINGFNSYNLSVAAALVMWEIMR